MKTIFTVMSVLLLLLIFVAMHSLGQVPTEAPESTPVASPPEPAALDPVLEEGFQEWMGRGSPVSTE